MWVRLAPTLGSYGIQVTGFQTSAALTKNTANGNGADGVFVALSVTAATLTGNNSSFNAALGINAAPGAVTDGGKNVVQDNISAKQCLNIVYTEV